MPSALFEAPLRHPINPMAESISYPPSSAYSTYYATEQPMPASTGYVGGQFQRAEPAARRRPKYTRSKTGCLTCRVKKIKCDETKPNCVRCVHGSRECNWPEAVTSSKRKSRSVEGHTVDGGRPSTAGSSGLSEASTPPTRDCTPPKREPVEVGIPPLALRRRSDPYNHVLPSANEISQHELGQRATSLTSLSGLQQHYAPLPSHPTSSMSHSISSMSHSISSMSHSISSMSHSISSMSHSAPSMPHSASSTLSHSGSSSLSHSGTSSLSHSPSSVLSSIAEAPSAYHNVHAVEHRYSNIQQYPPPLSPPLISRTSHNTSYRHVEANPSSGHWHQPSMSAHDEAADSYYPSMHMHSRVLVGHASMDGYGARYP